ncbi:MAG: MFS transporter, partial [Ginsengibacter sp.]
MKRYVRLYLDSYRGLSRPSWMLSAVMLINRIGAMVLPFLGVYMVAELKFTLSQTGAVLSCFGLGAMAGSTLGGWLTDRVGHFKVQLSSIFLSVPIFFLLPLFRDVWSLSIGVFVLSTITETFRPANSVSISVYAKPENITRSFSLNRMAVNLGFSIGPALGGILAAISFKLLFYGNGITALLAGLLFYFYFKKLPVNKNRELLHDSKDAKKIKAGISPWKDKPFLIYSLFCCLYSTCFFQLLSTLPLFYREVHHLSEGNIGLVLASNGLVVFLLEMLVVQVAERNFRSSSVITLGVFLGAISFLILLLPSGMWVLFLAMFIISLSEILAMPFMATVTVKRGPIDRKGAYMGLNALSFSSAFVFSPLIGTFVAEHFGFSVLWIGTAIVGIATAFGFKWIFRKF